MAVGGAFGKQLIGAFCQQRIVGPALKKSGVLACDNSLLLFLREDQIFLLDKVEKYGAQGFEHSLCFT